MEGLGKITTKFSHDDQSVRAEIRTYHFQNTSQESYSYANLLGLKDVLDRAQEEHIA
jgi:hypothetical protein